MNLTYIYCILFDWLLIKKNVKWVKGQSANSSVFFICNQKGTKIEIKVKKGIGL